MRGFSSRYRFDRSLNPQITSQLRIRRKRKNAIKNLSVELTSLKAEIFQAKEKELEQLGIREGQRQVREKFEAIEAECEQEQLGIRERQRQVREKFKAIGAECKQQQLGIREGQRQVREKFEAIEAECEQLRKETIHVIKENEEKIKHKTMKVELKRLKRETNQMIKNSAKAQIGLSLMLSILKARECNDFTKATSLTQLLRFCNDL